MNFDLLLANIKSKIANLLVKAIVHNIDDSTYMQLVKLSLNSSTVRQGVEHVQEYGFYSNCPTGGAECISGCINGNTDHVLAIVIGNSRKRMRNLESGEVAVRNGMTTDHIHLKNDGSIEAKTDNFNVLGDVADDMETLDDVRQRLKSLIDHYNNHTHAVSGTVAGKIVPPFIDTTPN